MWDGVTGAEITVYDAADQETHTARGFVLVAPVNADAPDPMETLRLALAQMSEADRTAVIAAAQRDRVAKLQEQLAALTDDQIESLLGATSPIKRGPGRPRKDQVA